MSGEALGLALMLPRHLEHAAYVTFGFEPDAALVHVLAGTIDPDGSGVAPLDAGLVLGNPPRAEAEAFSMRLQAIWDRLRPGAPFVVGAETLVARLAASRYGTMSAAEIRAALRRLEAPVHRSWQVYPSLSRPTILASAQASASLRRLALDQAGLARRRRAAVSHGANAVVAACTVPAVLWECRK